MDKLIKVLSTNLELENYEITDKNIYLNVYSKKKELMCPYCKTTSKNVHSQYKRTFQDLPIQGKKTYIIMNIRKMFCKNHNCSFKTFAERFDFIEYKAKKTTRLLNEIINISKNVSSLAAERILKTNTAVVSKSTICSLLKKNYH